MLTGNQCKFIAIFYILFSLQVFEVHVYFTLTAHCNWYSVFLKDSMATCSSDSCLRHASLGGHPPDYSYWLSLKEMRNWGSWKV